VTIDLSIWTDLLSRDRASLRDRAINTDAKDVAAVASLRKDASAELVRAALALAEARRKATVKFPQQAERLVADPEGVEVASSMAVAMHKAARFARHDIASPIVDLCCGIGGDAMGFTAAGLAVLAVDHDPVRAWMAQHNAGCASVAADVAEVDVAGRWIHLDPSRRSPRGRAWRLEAYEPGIETIGRCLEQARAGAVKLGPGVDLDDLPWDGEVELISEAGRLVQAVLWTGDLREHERAATVLPAGVTLVGEPTDAPAGGFMRHLYAIDPAVERAELVGQLANEFDLVMPHPKLGLLTGEHRIDTPFATAFEMIEQMPWRPKRVQAALRSLDAGHVEIKTRGKAVDPDEWQTRLSGDGREPIVVFVLREGSKRIALIARRL